MTSTSDDQVQAEAFAPRHFYFSRYLCVTNAFMCSFVSVWAIASAGPKGVLFALPFAAWAYVCLRELIQRKPAISVTAGSIVIRKLIFANADMRFDDIEVITKIEAWGTGTFLSSTLNRHPFGAATRSQSSITNISIAPSRPQNWLKRSRPPDQISPSRALDRGHPAVLAVNSLGQLEARGIGMSA